MTLDELRAAMEVADAAFQRQRTDSLHHRNGATYDTARAAAERYIAACYAFQRARWGRVAMKLTATSLLRG